MQEEIQEIVADSMRDLYPLWNLLYLKAFPQERLVALRQCVEKIFIDKPAGIIKLKNRLVPAGNLQATRESLICG